MAMVVTYRGKIYKLEPTQLPLIWWTVACRVSLLSIQARNKLTIASLAYREFFLNSKKVKRRLRKKWLESLISFQWNPPVQISSRAHWGFKMRMAVLMTERPVVSKAVKTSGASSYGWKNTFLVADGQRWKSLDLSAWAFLYDPNRVKLVEKAGTVTKQLASRFVASVWNPARIAPTNQPLPRFVNRLNASKSLSQGQHIVVIIILRNQEIEDDTVYGSASSSPHT